MFVVRSKSNPSRGEMIVIERPTPQLLDLLARESNGGLAAGEPAPSAMQPTGMRTAQQPEANPVVRAQSPSEIGFATGFQR
jgi:hypothetical protein